MADLDSDGRNDFVLSFRQKAPALVWYRRTAASWDRYVIDKDYLTVEAGGAVADIDGDGHPDLVFGADWQGGDVWWWRNPGGHYDPNTPWERHTIKRGGPHQHHDQVFANFKGTGKPQLAFWNQQAKQVLIADIPPEPRKVEVWPTAVLFSSESQTQGGLYAEGVAAADIDGDGKPDLVAGNYWFKHIEGNTFKPIKFAKFGGRVAVGRLIEDSKHPQIVVNSGDGIGPLAWYECNGDPEDPAAWVGHELVGRVIHGHSLQIADIDGDGHLDIFAAEMAKWTESRPDPDNPGARLGSSSATAAATSAKPCSAPASASTKPAWPTLTPMAGSTFSTSRTTGAHASGRVAASGEGKHAMNGSPSTIRSLCDPSTRRVTHFTAGSSTVAALRAAAASSGA